MKKYLSTTLSKYLLCVIILALITLINLNDIYAQTYNIDGTVSNSHLIPIAGVNVSVLNTNYGSATDEQGRYEIKNLSQGIYTIEFSAIGFEKLKLDSIIINDESITLNIMLTEIIFESEEVLITAGKYEQKKSELPVSSEILYGKEFTDRNFSNLEDAIRFVPGVIMTEDQVSIRGSSGYSRGSGSRALVAIDGLPFNTGDTGEIVWEMIPVTELQRVEIIKGPASSLYGSSAIGGVINALTKNISDKPTTIINGFYGIYDSPYYSEWDWSGEKRPFNGLTLSHSNELDNFGFNISFTRLEESGYKQDDDFKKYVGFLKTVYNFTTFSSLTFIANSFNKQAGNFLYWKDSHNALVPPDQNLGDRIETDRYLFGLIFKTLVSDKTILNVKTSYYRNYFKDNETNPNESTSNLYRGEIQLNTSVNDFIILTGGLDGNFSTVNSTLFGNPEAFGIGSYLVGDINFNFSLIVSMGIRYDYSKLDTLNGAGAISPKLGLNYRLFEELILRSSIGTGFRAPTLSEAFTSTSTGGITVKPNPNIKAEHNLTFELGINYTPFAPLNLDLAFFQSEYYDLIEPGIDPSDGLVFFSNVVRARIQGYEAAAVFEMIQNQLSLSFGYTYLWTQDLEKDEELRYRPRHVLYSSIDFRKWNFELGINFRYTSRVEEIDEELVDLGIVVDGDLRVPVYTTDVNLGYNFYSFDLPLNVYLNIKNIFNYNYVELIGNLRQIRSYSFGFNLSF
ncbi:MAG: TonB-dependent receptor domain-containing protein [Ignavibacteriales bacterium]